MNAQTIQSALNQVHLACVGFIPTEVPVPYTTSYKTEPLKNYKRRGNPRQRSIQVKWTDEDIAYLIECIEADIPQRKINMPGRSISSIEAKVKHLRELGKLDYSSTRGKK